MRSKSDPRRHGTPAESLLLAEIFISKLPVLNPNLKHLNLHYSTTFGYKANLAK